MERSASVTRGLEVALAPGWLLRAAACFSCGERDIAKACAGSRSLLRAKAVSENRSADRQFSVSICHPASQAWPDQDPYRTTTRPHRCRHSAPYCKTGAQLSPHVIGGKFIGLRTGNEHAQAIEPQAKPAQQPIGLFRGPRGNGGLRPLSAQDRCPLDLRQPQLSATSSPAGRASLGVKGSPPG